MTEPTLVLVEDDAALATLLQAGLTHHGYRVVIMSDGREALTYLQKNAVDVAILDVMVPGVDGLTICQRLAGRPYLGIIMLTARDAVADKIRALDCGADDYVTKPFVLEELVARVQAVRRRRGPQNGALVQVGDLRIDLAARRVWRAEREIALTLREYDVLITLAHQTGHVCATHSILEAVWGYDTDVTVVKVYIAYLRQKLNAAGEPDLVQTVRGVGYVLRDPAAP